jgi:hypothetical protein
MRQRAMSAGAAFSGFLAAVCLWTALAGGRPGPMLGFLAGTLAVVALVRASRLGRDREATLRLCPRRGLVLDEDGDGETPLQPIGITPHLICLARRGSQPVPIWRDSLPPDAFRRIAAYALWRRSAMSDPVDSVELIERKAVSGQQSIPRAGRPEGQ